MYCGCSYFQEDRQMAVVEEILRSEADGSISFGNHKLAKKAKVEDYEHAGDLSVLLKVTASAIHLSLSFFANGV